MFRYATYKTRQQAEDALEDMFASGEVSECEFHSIRHENGRWHVMLRA